MRQFLTCGFLLMTIVGCGSGNTPTPIPSNTPVPSPQDTPGDEPPPTPTDANQAEDNPGVDRTDDAKLRGNAKDNRSADLTSGDNRNALSHSPTGQDAPAAGDSPPPRTARPQRSALEQELATLKPATLVERLASDEQRDAATRVLAEQGSSAVEPLVAALASENWQVRAAAVFTLGQIGPDAAPAADQLKQLAANDPEPAVRDAATFALDQMARD